MRGDTDSNSKGKSTARLEHSFSATTAMSTATALGEAVGLVPFYMGHELAVQLAIFCGFFFFVNY
jgi:uncharacterized cupin superfamily protein